MAKIQVQMRCPYCNKVDVMEGVKYAFHASRQCLKGHVYNVNTDRMEPEKQDGIPTYTELKL